MLDLSMALKANSGPSHNRNQPYQFTATLIMHSQSIRSMIIVPIKSTKTKNFKAPARIEQRKSHKLQFKWIYFHLFWLNTPHQIIVPIWIGTLNFVWN